LEIGSFFSFAQANLDWASPLLDFLPGKAGMHHHAQFLYVEMGSHILFYSGWSTTANFPISASQVAKIKGKSHHCLAKNIY
jgi:hypothetical protein